MDQIIEIISWIGALQGLLLTLLLFSRRNNKSANRLLAFFIVIITLDCLEPIIFNGDHNGILFKTWEVVWGGLVFLHGPLLFLYVKKMTTGAPILQNTDLWHYAAPFIYYILILSTVVLSWPGHAIETGTTVVYELFFLHLLIYSALSLARIRKYQRSQPTNTSSLSTIDLSWLKMLLRTTLALYIISFITVQLQIIMPDAEVKSLNFVIQFFLVFIMYAISYKSISQPQIFFPIQDGGKVNGISKEKYGASSLDQENAERIRQKLSGHMQEKKPYLDPNLSLQTLSQQIGESRYHVSQVLNDKFKVKFNDFVNRYRVEEFKLLILKPVRRKPTVESLAQLSGFNSKTSFHTVFKKITGKTPSKFYKEALATKNKDVL